MSQTNVTPITDRRSPVRDVQDTLQSIERSHDDTLADVGQLITTMLRVGAQAGVHPADGQQALDRAIAIMAAGARMRALTIATHEDLHAVYGKLNLRELGFGALGPKPSPSAAAVEKVLAELGG